MRTRLTEQEIASYKLNGFLTVQDFLDDAELEEVRRWVSTAAEPDPRPGALPSFRGWDISDTNPDAAAFYRNPGIGEIVSQLEGHDRVRHLADQISFVMPGHGQTPFHIDVEESLGVATRTAVSTMVALDDSRWYNKAFCFLPGTHRESKLEQGDLRLPSERGASFGSIFDRYPQWRNIEFVVTEGRAGSCVFYNGAIAHGSAPNFTPRIRRKLAGFYIGDGESWNGTKVFDDGQEGFKGLKPGERFTDKQAPVIWERS